MTIRTDITKTAIVTGNEGQYRVSADIVYEFENTVLPDHDVVNIKGRNYYVSRITFRLWKYFRMIKPLKDALFYFRLIYGRDYKLFCVLMGPRFQKCFPFFLNRNGKAIYLFDAWPGYYDYILKFIRDFSIKAVFISSRQSTENLFRIYGENIFYWIPEGIDPSEYKYFPVEQKDIEVLCLGRKHEAFHQKIVSCLSEKKINYMFSQAEGERIFPDKISLITGLARTKISICFPASMTHPERAKGIETMTNRYLQAMASKCLIVGKAPREMIELFGYNPVVEADFENPSGQIIQILKDFPFYHGLIEKNHKEVTNRHTWLNRWQLIKAIMSEKMPG